MLADFKDNGPSSLPKYERKIMGKGKEPVKENGVSTILYVALQAYIISCILGVTLQWY